MQHSPKAKPTQAKQPSILILSPRFVYNTKVNEALMPMVCEQYNMSVIKAYMMAWEGAAKNMLIHVGESATALSHQSMLNHQRQGIIVPSELPLAGGVKDIMAPVESVIKIITQDMRSECAENFRAWLQKTPRYTVAIQEKMPPAALIADINAWMQDNFGLKPADEVLAKLNQAFSASDASEAGQPSSRTTAGGHTIH